MALRLINALITIIRLSEK